MNATQLSKKYDFWQSKPISFEYSRSTDKGSFLASPDIKIKWYCTGDCFESKSVGWVSSYGYAYVLKDNTLLNDEFRR